MLQTGFIAVRENPENLEKAVFSTSQGHTASDAE